MVLGPLTLYLGPWVSGSSPARQPVCWALGSGDSSGRQWCPACLGTFTPRVSFHPHNHTACKGPSGSPFTARHVGPGGWVTRPRSHGYQVVGLGLGPGPLT